MPQPIVIVMVKAPRAGEVKTRLVPPLSECEAASLAACFAHDTVLNAQRMIRNVLVAYAPADARDDLEAILGNIKDAQIDPRFVEGVLVEVKRQ